MLPGGEEKYKVAGENIRLYEMSKNLEHIKTELRKEFYEHDIDISITPIADGVDNFRLKVEHDYDNYFKVIRDFTNKELSNTENITNIIKGLTITLKSEIFRSEVYASQESMLKHLDANWPEVVADLVLNDLYHPPCKDDE
ncbi:hypothetical protein NVP2275O_185 [Vibrio phage 2.275.O._10N.286.54.E11]|nr:hypothetical protein NVP2275O_185 [Vibrio phage 2.275.O._10N.286.54.E11]